MNPSCFVLLSVSHDMEGQRWLFFSCHLHKDPSLQKVMWTMILKLQNLFPELPVVTLCDHNCIFFPEWDNVQIFRREFRSRNHNTW